jgi:hypothetical protein
MSRMIHIAACFIAVTRLATTASAFQVVPPPPGGYPAPIALRTGLNKDCLQPINKSTDQGAAIVQVVCDATAAQVWILQNVGNGNFHVMNALSGLCLDARGSATNRTPVQQWTCNGITNENWEMVGGGFSVNFKSRVAGSSNFCLDVPGGQTTVGLAMQIYGCNGTASQLWFVNPTETVGVPWVVGQSSLSAANTMYMYGLIPVLQKTMSPTQCQAAHADTIVAQQFGRGAARPKQTQVLLFYCK